MKRNFDITPPEALDKKMTSLFPNLDANIENLLEAKKELQWPDWCYLPMAASYAIVTDGAEIPFAKRYIANTGVDTLRAMSAIIPWRLNKVIYSFDEDLANELTQNNSYPENVPVQVLYRMPYPCVYIADPPGIADQFDGLFCFLEWDHRYPYATELRMHYLAKNGKVVGLYLQWADNRSLLYAHMAENAKKLIHEVGSEPNSNVTEDEYNPCISHIYKHLNLLLYLCSDDPDVERRQPIPRKRGRGKVQTASYPDQINVGTYIGSTIRMAATANQTNHEAASGTGTSKRPHMRRAHWHLYWTGPNRSVPSVRWVSHIFVNADRSQGPSVIIHPVKE